jgi:hypothetical protein
MFEPKRSLVEGAWGEVGLAARGMLAALLWMLGGGSGEESDTTNKYKRKISSFIQQGEREASVEHAFSLSPATATVLYSSSY